MPDVDRTTHVDTGLMGGAACECTPCDCPDCGPIGTYNWRRDGERVRRCVWCDCVAVLPASAEDDPTTGDDA